MIWEFIKDSPAWRIAGWFSLMYVAGWLILTQGDQNGVAVGAPLLVFLCHTVATNLAPDTAFRCTFFDAALPIAGPQLWISKMIVLLGSLWLPVLAASAVGFVVAGNPALPFLNAAGGITVMYLCSQSIRIRQFHVPRWSGIILIVEGAAISVINFVYRDSGLRVLAAYLAIAAVLFLVNLARVPKCFECSPPDPVKTKPVKPGAAATSPSTVWWKLWRSIFGWQVGMAVLVVWFTDGNSLIAMLAFAPAVALVGWSNWMYVAHLPVSPRKLFWVLWGPMAAAILIGNQIGLHFPLFRSIPGVMREPRVVSTTLALTMALFLCWMLVLHLGSWRRLGNPPLVVRACIVATFPVAVAAAWILIPTNDAWRRLGADPIPYYAIQLADLLPQNPALMASALAIPLLLLYWLAERTFSEMEYPGASQRRGQSYLLPS